MADSCRANVNRRTEALLDREGAQGGPLARVTPSHSRQNKTPKVTPLPSVCAVTTTGPHRTADAFYYREVALFVWNGSEYRFSLTQSRRNFYFFFFSLYFFIEYPGHGIVARELCFSLFFEISFR